MSSYHPDWVTDEDMLRYKKATKDVFNVLVHAAGTYVPVSVIENLTSTLRVAARINTLRDDWYIDTKRGDDNRATYRLAGKRTSTRLPKPHCNSCTCHIAALPDVLDGQIGLGL